MARSGVQVNEDCLKAYQDLMHGKTYKYIVFKIADGCTEIVVDKGSTDADYDTFLGDLPDDECRFAVYDFEYEKGDEGKRNKICFFTWSPDTARVKSKMVYASSKDALRRLLRGVAAEIQGTDMSEVSYQSVLDKVSRVSA